MKNVLEKLAAAATIIIGAAALLGWLNQALIEHLDHTFATKEDIVRVEKKVDKVLDRLYHPFDSNPGDEEK